MTVAFLFTMLTTKISQEVLNCKLCKEEKGKRSHHFGHSSPFEENWFAFTGDCPLEETVYFHRRLAHTYSKWSIFRGDQPIHSRLPWSIFMGDLPTHTQSGLFSGATSPHTHTYLGLFSWVTCPSRKRKSGLIIMGDLPRWRNGLIVMGDLQKKIGELVSL